MTILFQSDLCVLVMNGMTDNPNIEEKEIKELITGTCHMMSSRDVIVAINIKGDDIVAERSKFDEDFQGAYWILPASLGFREMKDKVSPILTKSIGPCFDVIPVDAERNIGVFAGSTFSWFKGSTLWPRLVENQKNINYDIDAVEKLRHGPFEMQIAFKYRVRGVGTVAAGRILCKRRIHCKMCSNRYELMLI